MDFAFESGFDQATADLIIQLQLQDVGVYAEHAKGKAREPTDEELAFHLQNDDLESVSQLLSDRRMAMSFAAAVQADAQILVDSQVEEDSNANDRDIARHWIENGGSPIAATNFPSNSESTALDDETLTKLQILYVSGMEGYQGIDSVDEAGTETEQAESSAWAARRIRQAPSRMHRCIACAEDTEFVNVVRVPCRHEYCRSCLESLFNASMTDESLFPPRCCRQPIVMSIARIFLKSDLVQQYEKKKIEFETPNRTYCYSAGCSAFIETSHIEGEVATCSDCGRTTCTSCKGRAHIGDCPNDTSLQQLLDTARENGWQRCFSCWRMVELDHGCNHMKFVATLLFPFACDFLTEGHDSCHCGAQFCYNCGLRWKSCSCEQWNEHRLLARAYQIIDREQNPPLAVAPPLAIDNHEPDGQLLPEIDGSEAEIQEASEASDEESQTTPEAAASVLETHITHRPMSRDILVARTIQDLRENHECDHDRWKYVRGPHLCEECSHYLPEYIFECRQCRLQACNRCRRNRL